MSLALTLKTVAGYAGHRPALSWAGGTLSYAELEAQVRQIAGALLGRHALRPGTRVALAMQNCWEFLPLLYGIWRAGLVAVPLNSKLHAREMAWIMSHAEVGLCCASPEIAEALSGPDLAASPLPPILTTGSKDWMRLSAGPALAGSPAAPDAEAWLFYTSGTTGRPKGAILTHRNLLFSCHCYYADIDALGPRDCILHAAPLTHGSGLMPSPIWRAAPITWSWKAHSTRSGSSRPLRATPTSACSRRRPWSRVSSTTRTPAAPTPAGSRP
jgi:long-chain acyl-CoA synthetase